MCWFAGRNHHTDRLRRVASGLVHDGGVDVLQSGKDCSEEHKFSLVGDPTRLQMYEGEMFDLKVELGQ